MPPLPQLAEALYLAHKQRSTGRLKVMAAGRESELLLQDGDLVGAEVRWGYRTPAQALLLAQRIDFQTLDALWAKAERGSPDTRALEECGMDARQALEVQALAHVDALTAKAESVRFQEGQVRAHFEPIPGARVVRAAWQWSPPEAVKESVFRCRDPARCEAWLLSDDERDFLRGFESFKTASGATDVQLGLLELLRREGSVESVEAAAQVESEEISWADLLNDEPPAKWVVRSQPAAGAVAPIRPKAEAEAMRTARSRAQDQLTLEMSEALRRASGSPAQDWLSTDASSAEAMIELSASDAVSVQDPVQATGDSGADPPLDLSPFEEALRQVGQNGGEQAEPESSSLNPEPGSEVASDGVVAADTSLPASPARTVEENEPANQPIASSSMPVEESDFMEEENLPSDPLDPSRARRQRLLQRSMENLGAPGARPAHPTSAAVVPPEPTAPAQTEDAAPHTSDQKALAEAVESRYRDVQAHKDYFTLLGLPYNASVEKVKAAFLELAKVFHPDRLPPALGHLSTQMRAIFEAVREAYDTLQSDPRRALYIASLPAPKADLPEGADPKKEAADAFKRGENLMRKRDYVGAEREFLMAFELDAQAVYLAATAWAVYMDPARRHDVPRAKQMMANALTRDPNCDRAHYQLGVIARVEGEMDRAEKHFRDAIRIAPKHLEANQELRLIQIRKKKDSRRKLFGGKSGK